MTLNNFFKKHYIYGKNKYILYIWASGPLDMTHLKTTGPDFASGPASQHSMTHFIFVSVGPCLRRHEPNRAQDGPARSVGQLYLPPKE
jgi:hypothetical protein